MDDLIEALTILRKYGNPKWPTHCEHDVMFFVGIDRDDITDEDINRLDELGAFWSNAEECFMSFKFGSA